jgi:hypothetical protein
MGKSAGSKTGGGGGGGGKGKSTDGDGRGALTATEQGQVEASLNQLKSLPPIVQQRAIGTVTDNIKKAEERIAIQKKAIESDKAEIDPARFEKYGLKISPAIKQSIERRMQMRQDDISKNESYIKVLKTVLSKMKK